MENTIYLGTNITEADARNFANDTPVFTTKTTPIYSVYYDDYKDVIKEVPADRYLGTIYSYHYIDGELIWMIDTADGSFGHDIIYVKHFNSDLLVSDDDIYHEPVADEPDESSWYDSLFGGKNKTLVGHLTKAMFTVGLFASGIYVATKTATTYISTKTKSE